MKVCVCSDSHGNSGLILKMLREESPDALLFAGDGGKDLGDISREIPRYAVRGNCDLFSDFPEQLIVLLKGRKVLLCHGHGFHVEHGSSLLCAEAKRQGTDIAVYGHTHVWKAEWLNGVFCLNPGSIGKGERTYALWDTDENTVAFRQIREEGIQTLKTVAIG